LTLGPSISISISVAKDDAKPADPATPPSYPRPTGEDGQAAEGEQGEQGEHTNQQQQEETKKDKKRPEFTQDHVVKQNNKWNDNGAKNSKNSYGGAGRISQPAGKTISA
jgi:hypothetical protein